MSIDFEAKVRNSLHSICLFLLILMLQASMLIGIAWSITRRLRGIEELLK